MTYLLKPEPIGTLTLYFNEQLSTKFDLYEGENILGKDGFRSDVVINLKEISPTHCKITLNKFRDYSIEDLGSEYGSYRVNTNLPLEQKQKLKPGKEYELLENKPFYLAKYKCVFQSKTITETVEPPKFDLKDKQAAKKAVKKPEAPKPNNPAAGEKGKLKAADNKRDSSPEKTDSPSIDDLFTGVDFSLKKKQPKQKRAKESHQKLDPFISLQEEEPKKNNQNKTDAKDSNKSNRNHLIKYLDHLKQKYPSPSDKIFAEDELIQDDVKPVSPNNLPEEKRSFPSSKQYGATISEPINLGSGVKNSKEPQASLSLKANPVRKDQSKAKVIHVKSMSDDDFAEIPSKVPETKETKVNTRKGKSALQEECLFSTQLSKNVNLENSKMIVTANAKTKNLLEKTKETVSSEEKISKGKKRIPITCLSDDEDVKIIEKNSKPKKKVKHETITFSNPILRGRNQVLSKETSKKDGLNLAEAEKKVEESSSKKSKNAEKLILVTPTKKGKKKASLEDASTRESKNSEEKMKISSKTKKIKKVIKTVPNSKGLIKRSDYYLRKRKVLRVIFSGFEEATRAKMQEDLKKLGAQSVEDKTQNFDVLVLEKEFRRTVKVLLAISKGVQVVTSQWLEESKANKKILDFSPYCVRDPKAQKKFDFNLEKSLERAQKSSGSLLAGLTFFISPGLDANDMSLLIKTLGGKTVSTKNALESSNKNHIIIVNKEIDEESLEKQKGKNVRICSDELIFSACLKQILELENYTLWPKKNEKR